jgi:hypothetical protein
MDGIEGCRLYDLWQGHGSNTIGVTAELADDMMAALGGLFESLSSEGLHVLSDLYTIPPGAVTTMANVAKIRKTKSGAHNMKATSNATAGTVPMGM